mmetsp:Transcript_17383/g.12426  ORF Transcript_17383/g.12426 Transcript_17383/m.12426 type:complete len:122 (-) Transcript_17383:36-401(-)|eukprot:CAMPEP_0202965400 /NCGR_PEP_ID=MMETSP1396-20130829/9385_1 /ASSEMBLY_ACC=CAM_ASM_000872 /TAXON_ID= /ORGANISM="Pseudokeronopsis sp., Strain Brazil" /LENGTH=121 /DNA_ID=CAMNT_0049688099 /DNA_START=163 /DNA_END=528 /DNA_ORIENTATION=-
MEINELKKDEILLKKESSASGYLLVKGKLKKSIYAPWNSYKEEEENKDRDLISLREDFSIMEGMFVFGDFDAFNIDKFEKPSRWRPCYIYALEPSVVVMVSYANLSAYMSKLIEAQRALNK